uniref:Amine oxidase n=1 Tax=Phallusia mammillata TaxID=59560 RepID=A0A6F9DTR5_9ASCI|nr:spermine oxidase-like [Phallusia mammillata]
MLQGQKAAASSKGPKVVIVGAGISGLAAAAKLSANNINNLLVLEGKNRIGGRISTIKIGDRFVEEGATWIHGADGNPILAIARSIGAKVEVWDYAEKIEKAGWHRKNGRRFSNAEIKMLQEAYKTHLAIIENMIFTECKDEDFLHEHRRQNVLNFFEEVWEEQILRGRTGEEEEILRSSLRLLYHKECQDAGVKDIRDCAIHSFAVYETLQGYDSVLPGGYDKILEPVAREIPESAIRLNSAVERIEWNDGVGGCGWHDNGKKPVRVIYNDLASGRKETVYADHVIVTVSIGCLHRYGPSTFFPPLPEDKTSACKRLSFDTVNKIALAYDQPFWSRDQTAVILLADDVTLGKGEHWSRDLIQFNVRGSGDARWLEGWLCGDHADEVEKLTNDEVGKTCTELFRKFVGPHVPEPTATHVTRWGSDRFCHGSYACLNSDTTGDDIDNLAAPLPGNKDATHPLQLLFAGEATSRKYFGTVHGAMFSGQREAHRILRHYSKAVGSVKGCNGVDSKVLQQLSKV